MFKPKKISVLGPALCILLSTALVNCAHQKIQAPPISASADPSAEIMRVDSSLQKSREAETDVYSPKNFSEAKKALDEAKKMRSQNKDNESILKKVSESEAYLNKANEQARVSIASLSGVHEARNAAVAADAPNVFPDRFKELDQNLTQVTKEAEAGNTAKASEERDELLKNYQTLELNSILQANLGKADFLIRQAQKEDAKKWAPNALKIAESKYRDAKQSILRNPRDKELTSRVSAEATYFANRALNFTRQGKTVAQRPPEATVNQMEQQSEVIQAQREEGRLNEEQLESMSQDIQDLESQRALDERFRQASAAFSPSEAEVVRKDHQLVVRLKGLNFKKSSATIPSRDFALLNKVAKVIRSFPDSQVVVAGSTDSVGSRETNLHISEKRAESVKDYLTANAQISSDKVKAIGLGSERPIASNKTEQGRALNRRVDIIIASQGTPSVESAEGGPAT